MRYPVTIVLGLAACVDARVVPAPSGDHPVPTDDTPVVADTAIVIDIPATDDSDPPIDTQGPADSDTPLDSASDTYVAADSAVDTAAGPPAITQTTTRHVHQGLHQTGQLLTLGPLVVTAVRQVALPPATNGFAAQEPGATAPDTGLYVDLRDGISLPAIGDLVVVTGLYVEWPVHANAPDGTIARLVVHPSIPGSTVATVGTAALPAPFVVDPGALADDAVAESLEGMLVRVDAGARLSVLASPTNTWKEFPLGLPGLPPVTIDPWFFDYTTALPIGVGDEVRALEGVVLYEPLGHKVAPRFLDDLEQWSSP